MTRHLAITVAAGLLIGAAALARVADEGEMQAEQEELTASKKHLETASGDYRGHRKLALQHVDQALEEVRQGLAAAARRETRTEKRIEQKQEKLERRKENIERQ